MWYLFMTIVYNISLNLVSRLDNIYTFWMIQLVSSDHLDGVYVCCLCN